MNCKNFVEKMILGLTMATSVLAKNMDDGIINNNTDDLENMGITVDTVFLMAMFGLTVATSCMLCTRICLGVTNNMIEAPHELQGIENPNGLTEIVDTRDITDVAVEVDDSNSDVTIVVYSTNRPTEQLPRVADISRF